MSANPTMSDRVQTRWISGRPQGSPLQRHAKVSKASAFLYGRPSRSPWGKLPFFLLAALALIVAACGGGSSSPNASTKGPSILHVVSAPGQGNPDNFNPYYNTNNGSAYGTQGFMYETLLYVNGYSGQPTPWLASDYTFSSDLKSLPFHLRSGVKWSDNQDLTSKDVAFTFNLMKQYPALDQNALWSSTIASVSAPDDATVVFALKQPNNTALYRIGGQTFIVPEHAWQNIGDPSKFTNDSPVVTGPYLLALHNSQLITYKKNPTYWGTKPAVDEIQVPSIIDNSHAVLEMAKGSLDWLGSGWDPSVDASFTGRDAQHNHTWFSPGNTVMLYMNLQKWPFNQLAVRQAISTAINRPQMVVGPASYAKPANPSGVLTPTYQSWIDPQYAGQNFIFDANQAQNILKQAGFTKGSDGFYADKSGRKLAFTLTVVSSWNDWVSDTQFIQKDLQAIGINATINAVGGYEPYINALKSGKYDAAVSWTDAGPTPYYSLNDMLYSGDSAQPGQNVTGSNFERWSDPATDTLLKQYATTTDQNAQKQAIAGLEKIVAQQLPTIPLTQNPYWDEYTTKNFTGWPDASNPFSLGAPYQTPDNEMVVLHLHPAA